MHELRFHGLEHPRPPAPRRMPRVAAGGAIIAAIIGLAVALVLSPPLTGGTTEAAGPGSVSVRSGRLGSATDVHGRAHALWFAGATPGDDVPFPPNRGDRRVRVDEVPSLYADGLACTIGCRPYAVEIGWPLTPFHQQHPIRAALNELRPGSLHVGVDIQATDGEAVYAVQPGYARVLESSGPNARVQVGNYIYWHINPAVRTGELVEPFETELGTVMAGYGHIAFSELDRFGQYVNPLRPEGTALEPYIDHARPVIGRPAVAAGGQVIVGAYSPQSFVRRTTYVTPVLAPAGLAYRLFDSSGTPLTPLEWSFRGTHLLPWVDRSLIYAPGAHAPGYSCFAQRPVCVPRWVYRVAGGFAPPLPPTLAPGRYRLTIYAWDWADHATALDTTLTMTRLGWRAIGRFPSVLFHIPGYFTQSELLPRVWGTRGSSTGQSGLLNPTLGLGRPGSR